MSTSLDVVLREARSAFAAGLWVRPAAEDGTKRPLADGGTWGKARLDAAALKALYPGRSSLGIETGHDGIEAIDFDDRETYEAVLRAAADVQLAQAIARIEGGYCDDTPSGGVRWLWFADDPAGNLKLARRPKPTDAGADAGVKVLIETRGTGGYAILAPSNGRTHPSGKAYVRRSGGFATIARVTPEERAAILSLLQAFDEMPRPDHLVPPSARIAPGGHRPGDDFCARASWDDVLVPHGWRPGVRRGSVQHWTRPGKIFGTSATTNAGGSDLLYVFSSSTEFEAERGYSKFSAYALLEHGSDYAAAARALGAQGFGDPPAAPTRREGRDLARREPTDSEPARGALIVRPTPGELNMVRFSTMTARPIEWIRPGHLARGKFTLLVGDPGVKKTWYNTDLCARVTRGSPWPEGGHAPAGSVIYISAEDGAHDTLLPRLLSCGADVDRVWLINGVGQGDATRTVSIYDLPALGAKVDESGAQGIIIDPLDDLLGSIDSHKNTEVRAALVPLVQFAEARGLWVLGVAHGTKANVKAIYKAQGSVGYTGVARIVLGMARHRDERERTIIASVKNNLGPDAQTLAFRIRDDAPVWDASGVESMSADDLWTDAAKGAAGRTQDAVAWLRERLRPAGMAGVPSEALTNEAIEAGISRRALWDAKAELHIRAHKAGFGAGGAWAWALPPPVPGEDEADEAAGTAEPDAAANRIEAANRPGTRTDTLSTLSAKTLGNSLSIPKSVPPRAREGCAAAAPDADADALRM